MSTLSLNASAVSNGTYPMTVQATGTFGTQVFNLELDVGNPAVSSITPQGGTTLGGTNVTIAGGNLAAPAPFDVLAPSRFTVFSPPNPLATMVTICGAMATVNMVTSTSIQATTGPHAEGQCDVVVTNTGGFSGTLTNGYAYINCATETLAPLVTAPGPVTVTQTLCQ